MDTQRPGKYKEVGPRGGNVDNPRIVTIDKGDRLPPTLEKGKKWEKRETFHIWFTFKMNRINNEISLN
ncbi:hypothetical protein J6TS1_33720 [Siminovitchia terrae]|uniref:YjzC family protein n=1 Tax=Siminovitchia terrae TaxID=1914933 RepID=A0ABQ4KZR1_SIMTE|nr:YjzC family protein [Siminovitchia terrae]GIN97502.1 hypothetical protein J6TS1_33720 [Siminovitchia terrae]